MKRRNSFILLLLGRGEWRYIEGSDTWTEYGSTNKWALDKDSGEQPCGLECKDFLDLCRRLKSKKILFVKGNMPSSFFHLKNI